MKQNRRIFLNYLGMSSLAGLIANDSGISNLFPPYQRMANVDWKELRKEFPLRSSHIYLNNGTFGPSPNAVIEELNNNNISINTTGKYGNSKLAIQSVAKFINALESEIALTHNTTEGINIMAQGLNLTDGDEIIMTDHEHVGSAMPWLNRAKKDKLNIKVFSPLPSVSANISKIKSLITNKTKVIAIPHVTCTTGQVLPIKEIALLANSLGIVTAIDGAHGLGVFNLDMQDLGVDMYASCGHKWLLGPAGTGALYISNSILERVTPVFAGAYTDSGWTLNTKEQTFNGYNPSAHRFFYGTQSKAQFSGMKAAIDFMTMIGMDKVEKRIRALNEYLYGALKKETSVEILTPQETLSRACMISFRSTKMNYKQIGGILSQNKIRVRLVPESNLDAVRISAHIYNNESEIDQLVKLLSENKL